eukprot:TRINITY_DN998_c0_g1_i1.p1 TRINITY_DN998_c0_g1~~TRINITY_DN998_c0_g1_i1.p1  ORF type:complete len:487 (+),score=128.10 TRINITY_DN998_c0_g1_i1:68-1528(+)
MQLKLNHILKDDVLKQNFEITFHSLSKSIGIFGQIPNNIHKYLNDQFGSDFDEGFLNQFSLNDFFEPIIFVSNSILFIFIDTECIKCLIPQLSVLLLYLVTDECVLFSPTTLDLECLSSLYDRTSNILKNNLKKSVPSCLKILEGNPWVDYPCDIEFDCSPFNYVNFDHINRVNHETELILLIRTFKSEFMKLKSLFEGNMGLISNKTTKRSQNQNFVNRSNVCIPSIPTTKAIEKFQKDMKSQIQKRCFKTKFDKIFDETFNKTFFYYPKNIFEKFSKELYVELMKQNDIIIPHLKVPLENKKGRLIGFSNEDDWMEVEDDHIDRVIKRISFVYMEKINQTSVLKPYSEMGFVDIFSKRNENFKLDNSLILIRFVYKNDLGAIETDELNFKDEILSQNQKKIVVNKPLFDKSGSLCTIVVQSMLGFILSPCFFQSHPPNRFFFECPISFTPRSNICVKFDKINVKSFSDSLNTKIQLLLHLQTQN